jgi:hypothetical protein
MEFIKKIYRKLVPSTTQSKIVEYRINSRKSKLKQKIIKYLEKQLVANNDPEKEEIVKFLKYNPLSMFPYEFTKKYNPEDIVVYSDNDCNMKYVLHESKRLYFPTNYEVSKIQNYYTSLLLDQDIDSPHRYEYAEFCVYVGWGVGGGGGGDIIIDAGAAEGIFALSVVERAKKLYLFECSEGWIESLQKTFEPWKEKVVIINKYISDTTNDICVTLDDFMQGEPVNFIKADIEGYEIKLMKGAVKILAGNHNLKIVLCTYHRRSDADDLKQLLMEHGFHTEFSKGYMILLNSAQLLIPPYLRRGVIRATKTQTE